MNCVVVFFFFLYITTYHLPGTRTSSMSDTSDDEIDQKALDRAFSVQKLYVDGWLDSSKQNFELLSTIRYAPIDGKSELCRDNFFLFDYHFERLELELSYFDFGFTLDQDVLLDKLIEVVQQADASQQLKVRLTIDHKGSMQITTTPVPARSNLLDGLRPVEECETATWDVFVDDRPVMISPFTSFKTTRRHHYTEARERQLAPNGSNQEVLVFNFNGDITEGSITNVAFNRPEGSDRWVTPPLSSGCLCGVMRSMLIHEGLVDVDNISRESIKDKEEILLMNGIHGVIKGVINLC